jgi:hypothetical protein
MAFDHEKIRLDFVSRRMKGLAKTAAELPTICELAESKPVAAEPVSAGPVAAEPVAAEAASAEPASAEPASAAPSEAELVESEAELVESEAELVESGAEPAAAELVESEAEPVSAELVEAELSTKFKSSRDVSSNTMLPCHRPLYTTDSNKRRSAFRVPVKKYCSINVSESLPSSNKRVKSAGGTFSAKVIQSNTS